jgi:hypothetical protein
MGHNRKDRADWDTIDGGYSKVSGYVYQEGIPVSRKVYLFEWQSKRLISSTWSRVEDGYYEFLRLKNTTAYWVVSTDYQQIFHTTVSDKVSATS